MGAVWKNRWAVVGASAVGIIFYMTVFTTFFTNIKAPSFDQHLRDFKGPDMFLTPVQIYKNTWDYWWDQHKLHRIKGPFHFYLPILFLYELPVLLLCFGAWWRSLKDSKAFALNLSIIIAVQLVSMFIYMFITRVLGHKVDWEMMDKKYHLTHGFHLMLILFYAQLLIHITGLLFAQGRRVEAFLTYWAITSLFAYSYAGEKVPWLTVHIVGPLCLIAGIQVQRMWSEHLTWSRTKKVIVTAAIAVFSFYQVRNQHLLQFVNSSSPAERMVYNHTSPDIKDALQIVDDISKQTNFGHNLPMLLKGEMVWPFVWYLRDYPNALMGIGDDAETTTRPVVMVDWYQAGIPNLTKNYHIRRMKVREWWVPPMLDIAAMTDIWRVFTPQESRREGLNAIQYAKSLVEWRKLWHYLAYREIWIDPQNPDWSNGTNEFALCIRNDLSSTLESYQWLSATPKREDVKIFRPYDE
jgi:uncharacterized protein (TIGR03663 family)